MTDSRHILHEGNGIAVGLLRDALETICGAAWLRSFSLGSGQYDNVEAEIAGTTPELVVIGAHLDSTASNGIAYDPVYGPAPGADDNLSGVFGVLEVAAAIKQLADISTPQRSIRFALFNAEEQFMRGSAAYARDLWEEETTSVVAMIAMDMIGWHSPGSAPYTFEVHGAGTDYSEFYKVAAPSADLSSVIAQSALSTAPSLTPQVYPLEGCTKDPATRSSDHSSFQYHDWPACLVSEDLWADICSVEDSNPPKKGNPHYHLATDVPAHLDPVYSADIARTVTAATWKIANP